MDEKNKDRPGDIVVKEVATQIDHRPVVIDDDGAEVLFEHPDSARIFSKLVKLCQLMKK